MYCTYRRYSFSCQWLQASCRRPGTHRTRGPASRCTPRPRRPRRRRRRCTRRDRGGRRSRSCAGRDRWGPWGPLKKRSWWSQRYDLARGKKGAKSISSYAKGDYFKKKMQISCHTTEDCTGTDSSSTLAVHCPEYLRSSSLSPQSTLK